MQAQDDIMEWGRFSHYLYFVKVNSIAVPTIRDTTNSMK